MRKAARVDENHAACREKIVALIAVNAELVEALEAARDRSITLDPFTLHTIDAAIASSCKSPYWRTPAGLVKRGRKPKVAP